MTAIAKINAEMEANKSNSYIQVIGAFLIQHIDKNPQDAGKLTVTDKTIAKSLDAMQKEAAKKKVGNMAVLTPDEGYSIVLKYFGIDGNAATGPSKNAAAPIASAKFSVKLDEFL